VLSVPVLLDGPVDNPRPELLVPTSIVVGWGRIGKKIDDSYPRFVTKYLFCSNPECEGLAMRDIQIS
jgi:hypothetical protein